MRKLIVKMLLTASIVVPGVSQAFDMSGTYDSSEGVVDLTQNGDHVTGRYTQDNGEITGLAFGNILEGYWIEDKSDRRCPTPKNGRYYWGRFSLEFTGSGFTGSWGHCNDTTTRSWNGNRKGTARSAGSSGWDEPDSFGESAGIEGVWSSSEGEITFRQQGKQVKGSYPVDNGEIQGNLENGTLRGYWIEDHSATRCSSPKNGRYFWGPLEFRFSGDTFDGRWGYCTEKPSRQWKGQRK